jgi:hypothetical protein
LDGQVFLQKGAGRQGSFNYVMSLMEDGFSSDGNQYCLAKQRAIL